MILTLEELQAVSDMDVSKLDVKPIEKRALEKIVQATKTGLASTEFNTA